MTGIAGTEDTNPGDRQYDAMHHKIFVAPLRTGQGAISSMEAAEPEQFQALLEISRH
jgi:hypothetical protein